MGTTKTLQPPIPSSALERAAYTIPEFCFRNHISRPAYHRMRSEGRGPVEMRVGLNLIRITAEAEREWQRRMQEPNAELEQQAVARAVRAGEASAKSNKHISKRTVRQVLPPPDAGNPRARTKRRANAAEPQS